jgi:hypothetical protein
MLSSGMQNFRWVSEDLNYKIFNFFIFEAFEKIVI